MAFRGKTGHVEAALFIAFWSGGIHVIHASSKSTWNIASLALNFFDFFLHCLPPKSLASQLTFHPRWRSIPSRQICLGASLQMRGDLSPKTLVFMNSSMSKVLKDFRGRPWEHISVCVQPICFTGGCYRCVARLLSGDDEHLFHRHISWWGAVVISWLATSDHIYIYINTYIHIYSFPINPSWSMFTSLAIVNHLQNHMEPTPIQSCLGDIAIFLLLHDMCTCFVGEPLISWLMDW